MNLRFIGSISASKGTEGKFQLSGIPAGLVKINAGTKVFVGFSPNFTKEYSIKSWSNNGSSTYVELNGINSKEAISTFKEQALFVDEADGNVIKETEGFYIDDLIGCQVFNFENQELIGIIDEVLTLPANDVWLVATVEGMLPVPYIDDVVKVCDVTKKRVEICLIPGLIDLLNNKTEG